MHRLIGLSLVALMGVGTLAGSPAAAQQRTTDSYSVAEHEDEARSERPAFRGRIPAGTEVAVTLKEEVPIERDRIGETFNARVERDVRVEDGVVIPAGAPAKVKLVESSERENAASLRLSKIEVNGRMRSVEASDARADTERSGMSTGERTAVGAAAGAVVGAVTGAGVLEGAVVGAGGGLAWGLLSDRDREIDDGTTLRFELQEDLNAR